MLRYGLVLCCLLFAVRAFAADDVYFDGYVGVKGFDGDEGENVVNNARAQYVVKVGSDEAFFELTLTFDDEPEDPLVFSAIMRKTEEENVIALYSADGEQRIGTGTGADADDVLAATLNFSLLYKGMKVGDVKIDKRFDDGGFSLYLNFKLTGTYEGGLAFESTLPLDMAKTMRCSQRPASEEC